MAERKDYGKRIVIDPKIHLESLLLLELALP